MSGIDAPQGWEPAGYTLQHHLGSGSMGGVWLARQHASANRLVAVKRISTPSPTLVARIRREGEVLSRLDHPHIVRIFELLADGAGVAIVMQYAPGGSLRQRLDRTGALSPAEVCKIGAAMGAALASAHRLGVLHRDVKPANILFTSDSEPLLSDFGIARMRVAEPLTAAGSGYLGTAEYLDPAVAEGAEPDERSDVYSLGVACYEMLTGRAPFSGPNPLAVLRAADRGKAAPILSVSPHVPVELAAAVNRAMARDPQVRHPNATEFAADLRRCMGEGGPRSRHVPGGAHMPTGNRGAGAGDPDARHGEAGARQAEAGAAASKPGAATEDPHPGQAGAVSGWAAAGTAHEDFGPGQPYDSALGPVGGPGKERDSAQHAPAATSAPPLVRRSDALDAGSTRSFGPRPPKPAQATSPPGKPNPVVVAVIALVLLLAPPLVALALGWIGGDQDHKETPDGATGQHTEPERQAAPADTSGARRETAGAADARTDVAGPRSCPEPRLPQARGGQRRLADLGGDGCPDIVVWDGHVLTVPEAVGDARYALDGAGAQLLLGDWSCDGRDTPGLYRPDTGEAFLFQAWPSDGQAQTSDKVIDTGVLHGQASTVVGPDGCDRVEVRGAPGSA